MTDVASIDLKADGFRPVRRSMIPLTALACIVLGVCMLAAAALLQQRTASARQHTERFQAELAQARTQTPQPLRPETPRFDAPPYSSHLSHVEALLQLAKQHEVSLGTLAFRSDAAGKLPVLLRILEFRVEADYPRLKAFTAEVLAGLPNVYLEEIRIDKGGETTATVRATLRLHFVYDRPAHRSLPTERTAK